MRQSLKRNFYPLPDALLGLYVLCTAREYLWALGGSHSKNVAAWTASAIVAGFLVWLWSAKRGTGWEGTESSLSADWHAWRDGGSQAQPVRGQVHCDWLWLSLVVAPLLIFFFLRAPFPSLDFDNLNYHLVNTERALRGWPMIAGDFFPGTLLVNPAPDMAFGVMRALVGHRLSPLLNVAALLWTAQILNEMLAPLVARKSARYLSVLLILGTEHLLFLINLYMVDLLSIPLLLAALLLTIRFRETEDKGRSLVKISLLMGLAIAFKLTNVCFVLPAGLLLCYELLRTRLAGFRLASRGQFVLAALAAILPSSFFLAYMWRQTGNPLFPYYNQIFKSPLLLPIAYVDLSHGPANLWQKVLWPIVSFVYPERLSAMGLIIYSGRLNLGFVIALALLFSKAAPQQLKKILLIMIASTILWSFISGDVRYALPMELIGGISCWFAVLHVWRKVREREVTTVELYKRYVALALFTFFFGLCSLLGVWNGLIHFECSSDTKFCDRPMQPYFMTAFVAPTFRYFYHSPLPRQMSLEPSHTYFHEAAFFMRDQSDARFLTGNDREAFRDVDAWLNCHDSTSGFMALAAPDKPMISVARFLDLFDYMKAPGAQQRVRELLAHQRGKNIYTLILESDLETVQHELERASMGIHLSSESKQVSVPLYSPYVRPKLLLIKVLIEEPFDKNNHIVAGNLPPVEE